MRRHLDLHEQNFSRLSLLGDLLQDYFEDQAPYVRLLRNISWRRFAALPPNTRLFWNPYEERGYWLAA